MVDLGTYFLEFCDICGVISHYFDILGVSGRLPITVHILCHWKGGIFKESSEA